MAGRSGVPAGARWGAIVLVVALAAAVAAVAYLAWERANPHTATQTAAPVPTFSLGVETATPTPMETTPEAAAVPREQDRFLSIGSASWWRSTAGACGGAEPLVERSDDAGATWVDVTGRYRDIAAVASLDAFAQTEAEMVVAVGDDCETQGWRTFTQGSFWEPYDDAVLSAARYISPTDAGVVELPSGPIDAPCAQARGLRASGDTIALVCDAQAWVLGADASWTPFDAGAVAVTVDAGDVIVAGPSADCDGLALTRYAGADPAAATSAGCAADADASEPAAIAVTADGIVAWSGDTLTTVVG